MGGQHHRTRGVSIAGISINESKIITNCLDKLEISENELVAIVLPDWKLIPRIDHGMIKAIHLSKKQCIVFSSSYDEEAIFSICKE